MIGSRRRGSGAVIALVVVASTLVFGRVAPASTEAAWADTESGAGSFTALTVPPPTITGCTVVPGLAGVLGAFAVTFTLPTGYAIASAGYAVAGNAAMTGATAATPSVSGPVGATYTASFGTGILGLLGSNAYLGIRIAHSSGWVSTYKVAYGQIGLLASSSSCTVL